MTYLIFAANFRLFVILLLVLLILVVELPYRFGSRVTTLTWARRAAKMGGAIEVRPIF